VGCHNGMFMKLIYVFSEIKVKIKFLLNW
jgi:hypothetical protein